MINDSQNADSTQLVHVRGVKHSGKSQFISKIGRLLYSRNLFPFKISYTDMGTISSAKAFQELIRSIDADIKASIRPCSVMAESGRSREMLLLFDNVNELSPQLWEQFEIKLTKICKQKNVKIVITSTNVATGGSSIPFTFFRLPEDSTWFKTKAVNKHKLLQFREIELKPLTDDEAIAMLLSLTRVEISEADLNPKTTGSIRERLKQE